MGGLDPPPPPLATLLYTPMNWRSPEKLFRKPFFLSTLAAVSLVLGLQHSCPWPREGLSSEACPWPWSRILFVFLASSLVSSTPPLRNWSLPWPIFNNSKNRAVLEPRTGHFRGLAGFEAKDFKLCPRGQGRPQNSTCDI